MLVSRNLTWNIEYIWYNKIHKYIFKVHQVQVKKLAEKKAPDLNAVDLAGAMKTIDGTARAMGITSDIHDMSLADLRAKLA